MTNTPSTTGRLKFLQINLQHSYAALLELCNIMDELDPDVVLIQEPYVNKQSKIISVPVNYICYDKIDLEKKFFSAAILIKKNLIFVLIYLQVNVLLRRYILEARKK